MKIIKDIEQVENWEQFLAYFFWNYEHMYFYYYCHVIWDTNFNEAI